MLAVLAVLRVRARVRVRALAVWAGVLLALALAYAACAAAYARLPQAVPAADTAAFSEERASVLGARLAALGARPMGTAPNRRARSELEGTLAALNASAPCGVRGDLTWRVHQAAGAAHMGGRWHVWEAEAVANIVAVLRGTNASGTARAFLVNAHYDTVTLSPGAYDDGASVTVALDVLHALCHADRMENDLVVLLNNGEEMGLYGSAHFVAHDPLFAAVAGFINLDCFPGTKAMLFESTGSWLDHVYKRAPHPFGNVVAQDIFDTGLLKSYTDYEIFSRAKPGIDLAYFDERQRYHTTADIKTTPGSLQFLGDNVLAVLRIVLTQKDLNAVINQAKHKTSHVYFDVLGLFYVVFPKSTAQLALILVFISLVSVLAAVLLLNWMLYMRYPLARIEANPIKGSLAALGKHMLGCIVGVATSALLGALVGLYKPMFYYDTALFAVIFYLFACLFGYTVVQFAFSRQEECAWADEAVLEPRDRARVIYAQSLIGVSVFWLIWAVLGVVAAHAFGSVYIVLTFALFALPHLIVHQVYEWYQRRREVVQEYEALDAVGDFTNTELLQDRAPEKVNDYLADLTKRDLLLYAVNVLLCSLIPTLILLWIFHSLLLLAIALLPAPLTGVIVAVVTLLVLSNFYPWLRLANIFGLVAIICLLGVAVCAFAAFLSSPFTQRAPFAPFIHQSFEALSNTSTIYLREELYMNELVHFMYNNLEAANATCSREDGQCACTFAAKPPLIPPTAFALDEVTRNGSLIHHYNFSGSTQGALVHEITFSTNVSIVTLNGRRVSGVESVSELTLLSGVPWLLGVTAAEPLLYTQVTSNYDLLTYSPPLEAVVKKLASYKWVAFKGTGSGLVRVSNLVQVSNLMARDA